MEKNALSQEQYLLVKVSEECNETGQRAAKCLCFGMDEKQEGQDLYNFQRLIYEFNDIVAVMELLFEKYPQNNPVDRVMVDAKKDKLRKWMEYSVKQGTLQPFFKGVSKEEFDKFIDGRITAKETNRLSDPPVTFYYDKDIPIARVWHQEGFPKRDWTRENNSTYTEKKYEILVQK